MKISAVLLAASLWGAWALAFAAAAAGGPGQVSPAEQGPHAWAVAVDARPTATVDSAWQHDLLRTAGRVAAVVRAGYERVPVLVLILSALLVLPAVALASLTVRRVGQLAGRERRQRPTSADWTRGPRPGPDVPSWPAQAWLSVDGDAAGAHPVAGEMIRIGRHPDNEVWLTDTSVHRYHAVIHRTEDADFFITDLSGEEGNGMRVNGTRRAQSQLADGDVIELGKARITFASIPI